MYRLYKAKRDGKANELLYLGDKCEVYLNLIKILLEGGGGIKGTVSVISSDPSCKDGNARLTMVALKPLSYQ